MSELFPVPQEYEPDWTPDRSRSRGCISPPRPWTDPTTDTKYPVVFDPRTEHYQVGITAGPTLRVSADAYAQFGARAFTSLRQATRTRVPKPGQRIGTQICDCGRGNGDYGAVVVCFFRDAWTLDSWESWD